MYQLDAELIDLGPNEMAGRNLLAALEEAGPGGRGILDIQPQRPLFTNNGARSHMMFVENINGRVFMFELIEGWAVDLTANPGFFDSYLSGYNPARNGFWFLRTHPH